MADSIEQGSKRWHELRKLCTEPIPGKYSALYYLVAKVMGLEDKIPLVPRTHYALALFAERATGIPEIDGARAQLIQVARGFGKSALVTIGRSIQRLVKDPEWTMGIGNETQGMASQFLGGIKENFESNEFLRALFPEVIPANFRDTTWRDDMIVVNRPGNNPNPSVLAVGVGGTKTGTHVNEWILDDVISQNAAENAMRGSFTEIEAANRWLVRLPPMLNAPERDPITVIGCIAHNEPVLMADGSWKPIQDIQLGDEVWACKKDGSGGFKARRVTGVWPQGEAEVVEVRAAGRKLRCTPDHPLLAAAGRTDGAGRRWEPAGSLSCKVEVFEDMQQEGDSDEDFMWLLGFLWGDGWVTKYERSPSNISYSVSFALGEDEALNQRAKHLLEARYGLQCKDDSKRCTRMDSVPAGRELEALGLKPGAGAGDKRLPSWLWSASRGSKRAFLRGFVDADGSQTSLTRWAVELANGPMVRDLHRLAQTCGVRPTSITHRTRTQQAPNSPAPTTNTFYHVGLNFLERAAPTHRYKPVVQPCIIAVPVYDLSVEGGDCAFVASGIPVGNTPWFAGDTYEFVEQYFGGVEDLRQEPDFETIWTLKLPDGTVQHIPLYRRGDLAVFKRPALIAGKSIFPERWTTEELEAMSTRPGTAQFFQANYMLNPTGGIATTFNLDWLQGFEWEGSHQISFLDQKGEREYRRLSDLTVFMSVDPAFSDKQTSARTAIPVIGTDGTHLFLLEDFAEHGVNVDEIAHRVVAFSMRYNPTKIFVETIVAQIAVADAIRRVAADHGLELPIEEIKSHGREKKDWRIYGLEPYFRKQIFYCHKSHHAFREEYGSFPLGKLRDLLDAISFQRDAWELAFKHAGGVGLTRHDRERHDRALMDKVRASLGSRRYS